MRKIEKTPKDVLASLDEGAISSKSKMGHVTDDAY